MTEGHPPPTDPGLPPTGWVYNYWCYCPWCVWEKYITGATAEQFDNQDTTDATGKQVPDQ